MLTSYFDLMWTFLHRRHLVTSHQWPELADQRLTQRYNGMHLIKYLPVQVLAPQYKYLLYWHTAMIPQHVTVTC